MLKYRVTMANAEKFRTRKQPRNRRLADGTVRASGAKAAVLSGPPRGVWIQERLDERASTRDRVLVVDAIVSRACRCGVVWNFCQHSITRDTQVDEPRVHREAGRR